MHDVLQRCRSNFGERPRRFSLWDRFTYFRVPKPVWLIRDPTDKLMTLFRNLESLFSEGTVVWGHIIQANRLMFEHGTTNCPGELVYSIDDATRVEPGDLQEIAHALFRLKGTEPTDPKLQPIAEYLTNELIRVFGLPVPRAISPSIRCLISTTYFFRKHLPMRRLCTPLLPVVVNPNQPHVAMPLPERYWPQELVAWWIQ